MSLDFTLYAVRRTMVFDTNITHNLNKMAEAVGIYKYLWHPEQVGVTHAQQMIAPLRAGLAQLKADPARYETFSAPNGWGTYAQFVPWVEQVLAACEANPDAEISVSV